jgi:hypothetical protein
MAGTHSTDEVLADLEAQIAKELSSPEATATADEPINFGEAELSTEEPEVSLEENDSDETEIPEPEQDLTKKKELSPKAQKRYAELARRANEAEAKNQELEARLRAIETGKPYVEPDEADEFEWGKPEQTKPSPTSPVSLKTKPMPWDPQPEATDENYQMSPEELKEMIATKAQEIASSIVGDALNKEREVAQFKNDLSYVEEKYPEFNPDREDVYNDSLVGYVKKTYPALKNARTPDGKPVYPGLTMRRFIDDTMGLLEKRADSARSEATRNISSMEDNQPVAPTASPGKKTITLGQFKNMSIEEMERVLPMAAE